MQINWRVRVANPTFWRSLIAALGTLAVAVLGLFGIDAAGMVEQWMVGLTAVAVAVFGVLNVLGVVADPTTEGLSDSTRAMGYESPAPSLSTVAEEADNA